MSDVQPSLIVSDSITTSHNGNPETPKPEKKPANSNTVDPAAQQSQKPRSSIRNRFTQEEIDSLIEWTEEGISWPKQEKVSLSLFRSFDNYDSHFPLAPSPHFLVLDDSSSSSAFSASVQFGTLISLAVDARSPHGAVYRVEVARADGPPPAIDLRCLGSPVRPRTLCSHVPGQEF